MYEETGAFSASTPTATPKKKAKSSPKKAKTAPSHPKVADMVVDAITVLKKREGSSLQAIKKHIGAHHKVDMDRLTPFIKKYLESAVAGGILVHTKGGGATDCFKFSASDNCSEDSPDKLNDSPLPRTSNYLTNPSLVQTIDMQNFMNSEFSESFHSSSHFDKHVDDELVLKVRTSDPPNQDFVEVEVLRKDLSHENVLKICCEELEILPKSVFGLRKLPNTIVRKDKDVLRFQNFQELELVINLPLNTKQTTQSAKDCQKASRMVVTSAASSDAAQFVSTSCLIQ